MKRGKGSIDGDRQIYPDYFIQKWVSAGRSCVRVEGSRGSIVLGLDQEGACVMLYGAMG